MWPDKEKGFMTFKRDLPMNEPRESRVKHWKEFAAEFDADRMREQAYRCMNCGVPFCTAKCPLGNVIPDFNNSVKDDDWSEAIAVLASTNNFPEITGRVCPAPCEAACCLGVNEPPVTIKNIERAIAQRAWNENWLAPQPPTTLTGKRVAVVGSGPAGLAAAQQLRRAGHEVTVFERDDEPGGLLLYGIPDFKLEKEIVRRRVRQMQAEGVEFRCSVSVGRDVSAKSLTEEYDAVLLAIGSTEPRGLDVLGADLAGIHPAVDFLRQQNRRVAGKGVSGEVLTAKDKNVIVLGGGDTGSDCVGTSLRQGARSVWSFELLPKPPEGRNDFTPWPEWPIILRTSTSHEEGGQREWSIMTKGFAGENGQVKSLQAVRLEWSEPDADGRRRMQEIPGSEFEMECDLVLLALGFLHPEQTIAEQLGLELDARGNVKAEYGSYKSSNDKVFVAGDARRGQSLVVWAIHEGREAARAIDLSLMGYSELPSSNSHGYDVIR